MSRSRDEAALLAAALDLLALRGIPALRINAGQLKVGSRLVRLAPAGTSDILAILPPQGRFLAIEVKTPSGRLTADQRAFLEGVRRCGGVAMVVRDLKVLQSVLDVLLDEPGATPALEGRFS